MGVSYDTPEKNRAFAAKNDLPFRLLSDSDRELAKSVGASRSLLPYAKRVSYLVSGDGIVLANYPDVDPKTHAAEVIVDFSALLTTTD